VISFGLILSPNESRVSSTSLEVSNNFKTEDKTLSEFFFFFLKEETFVGKGRVFERKQVRGGETHLGLRGGKWPRRGLVKILVRNFEEGEESEEELTGKFSAHDMFDWMLKWEMKPRVKRRCKK